MVTLTVKDKIVERFVIMVREHDVIPDCSAHDPACPVSKDADR
jgi:hypothetical protein